MGFYSFKKTVYFYAADFHSHISVGMTIPESILISALMEEMNIIISKENNPGIEYKIKKKKSIERSTDVVNNIS